MGGKPRPPSAKQAILALRRMASRETRDGLRKYGIPSEHALGVTVGDVKRYAKKLGRSHCLAAALWDTGYYEARLLAAFVDEPRAVSRTQMDQWTRDFDSWAICDTVCFSLFDRTDHAWDKVHEWASAQQLYTKRAAFALIWSLSVHDKLADDATFSECMPLITRAAADEREHVKKGVDMALRAIGKRNKRLNRLATDVAAQLRESENRSTSWIGRSAYSELTNPNVRARLRG